MSTQKHEEVLRELDELGKQPANEIGLRFDKEKYKQDRLAIIAKHFGTQEIPAHCELCGRDITGELGYFLYLGDNCCGNPIDAEPELTKGDWVKSKEGNPVLLVDTECDDYPANCTCLNIKGQEFYPPRRNMKPVTFKEKDLERLDTEENIFELTQDGVGYWWAECLDKEKSVDYTCRCGKTADEAIRNAFNSVLAENLRLLAVK